MMRRHILLSGGIGSGKSAVAGLLRERGIEAIDADSIGHEVLEPDGEAYAKVVEEWPSVLKEGRIDRGRLAAVVFDDPVALHRLESISHPAIRERIMRLVAESDASIVAVEVPLMSDFLPGSWMRVIVDASDEVRRRRLRDRGMKERDIDVRMMAQPSRAEWLESADWVVNNDGHFDALQAEVEELIEHLWG
ncbi:MAG: dephospho-CoA kinase [Acidimicrobiia bacterium]|nr:dephospho-CoA kinase [Acidimicrobiia bacterium]